MSHVRVSPDGMFSYGAGWMVDRVASLLIGQAGDQEKQPVDNPWMIGPAKRRWRFSCSCHDFDWKNICFPGGVKAKSLMEQTTRNRENFGWHRKRWSDVRIGHGSFSAGTFHSTWRACRFIVDWNVYHWEKTQPVETAIISEALWSRKVRSEGWRTRNVSERSLRPIIN